MAVGAGANSAAANSRLANRRRLMCMPPRLDNHGNNYCYTNWISAPACYAHPMSVDTVDLRRLGEHIRRLRVERGMSQEALAEPAYTAAFISHIEHGKRRASRDALEHIAAKLDVTIDQLLTGRDPHDDLRLEIEIQDAIAQVHAGRGKEAARRLRAAHRHAEEVRNLRAAHRAEEGLGLALLKSGQVDRARGVFHRLSEAADGKSPEARTAAVVGEARCLFQLGDVLESAYLLESHLVELQRSEPADPTALLQVYAALIPPYFASGLLAKAKEVATRGWKIAPQVPDLDQRACLYVNRAGLLLTQGHARDALASLALAEDAFRQLGWHTEVVKVGLARAHAFVEDDNLTAAEDLLRELLEQPGDAIGRTDRAQGLVRLAEVRRRTGDADAGLATARQAIKVAGPDLTTMAAEAHREAGLCSAAAGDAKRALTYWRKALKLFHEVQNKEDVAKTARLIGDHYLSSGDPKKAAATYREGLQAMGDLR